MTENALFQDVDCIRISVPDLAAGLDFYRDRLGHRLLWRLKDYAGLQIPGGKTEIVLDAHLHRPEVFMKVKDVNAAVEKIKAAGGKVTVPPYEIEVGLCAAVQDPWGNSFVLMDTGKGLFTTDAQGNVTGVAPE